MRVRTIINQQLYNFLYLLSLLGLFVSTGTYHLNENWLNNAILLVSVVLFICSLILQYRHGKNRESLKPRWQKIVMVICSIGILILFIYVLITIDLLVG